MSFGRHACRHALKPSAAPILEHPWVSDDLLAATFLRFASGQRRHGSCVPGPLEARRRLARRRNTALAGIGGLPAEDIACLFGRNGREHMKWTDHPWQRTHAEPHNLNSYAFTTADASLPFYDHNPDPIDERIPEDEISSPVNENEHEHSNTYLLEQFMDGDNWGIEDVRQFTRRLGIDLQREPEYSRQIFDRLLMCSTASLTEAIRFLDDPFLNTRGSGNYLAAVKLFVRSKQKRCQRTAVLDSIIRALELGLIPSNELRLIVEALPNILVERKKTLGTWDRKGLLKHYRAMWRAIGRCSILGYGDLGRDIVDSWLEELKRLEGFRMANEIINGTHDASSDTYWPSTFILEWLEKVGVTDSPIRFHFPVQIFDQVDAGFAAKCMVDVTERLALKRQTQSNENQHHLEQWKAYLAVMSNASAIGSSHTWTDLPLAHIHDFPEALTASPSNGSLSIQHQIILRLWILRSLTWSIAPLYEQIPKATDHSIYHLLNLYETTMSQTRGSFLADFLHGIQDLKMPYNGLLLLAVDLKLRKLHTKSTRQTLEALETSQTSLVDVWTNYAIYNVLRPFFHGAFEQMLRRVDLTDPQYIDECLRIARVGDSNSIWSIIRLLQNHTPFKLSLHKAWVPIPHPDEMVLVRYYSNSRDSQCPDPHVAVNLVHQLAVTFSCCQQLSPRRSYHLVHWLYVYLIRYNGPIYPSLVRAMYHAGVVRFRREGRRISPVQYAYIMGVVRQFEGEKVVRQLHDAPQIGRSCSTSRSS